MPDIILKGDTNTEYIAGPFNNPMFINDFLITNKTGGVVDLNIQIANGNIAINIAPQDLQLAQNTSYGDEGFTLQQTETFIITVNGSVDFYIALTQIGN